MGWFNRISHLPLPTGPYIPGMIDVMSDYGKTSLFMRFYYPTSKKLNLSEQSKYWKNWIPDASYLDGIASVLMLYTFVLKTFSWWSAPTKIPALYGIPIRNVTSEKHKCIIFSHGLGGSRFIYSNICCELASRGFLVVALEHKDQSACNTYYYNSKSDVELDNRTTIKFQHIKLGKKHYKTRNDQIKHRSDECSRTMDFLKELNKQGNSQRNILDDSPLHENIEFKMDDFIGNLDLENLILMGHSFGGGTALYTLSKRSDLKLGILLDPWMFPIKNEAVESKILQPLLFVNTQTFHIHRNIEEMSKVMKNTNSKRQMYTIKHTTHENQTDSVLLIGYWLNWFMKKINPLTALEINNSLILRYLNEEINYPKDIQNCRDILEREQKNFEDGITKPWA